MEMLKPMTPAEKRAFYLYERFVDEARLHNRLIENPGVTNVQRSAQAKRMMEAEKTWQDAWKAMLAAPTPEDLRIESGRLFAEGILLVAIVCGFAGLLLPMLGNASTGTIAIFLGAWCWSFGQRLGRHMRRRL